MVDNPGPTIITLIIVGTGRTDNDRPDKILVHSGVGDLIMRKNILVTSQL